METVRGMVATRCELPEGYDVGSYEMFQGRPFIFLSLHFYSYQKSLVSFNYKNNPGLSNGGATMWDFAILISNNHFICCAENYRLFLSYNSFALKILYPS